MSKTPDWSAIIAQDIEQSRKRAKALRDENARRLESHPNAFVGTSLLGWMPHIQKSGIPFVPCETMGSIGRETYLRFGEEGLSESETHSLIDLMQKAQAAASNGFVVRWDPCASLSLKRLMQIGESSYDAAFIARAGQASIELEPQGDPRAYDIIYEFPLDDVALLSRPWFKAQQVESHPLEFRVFIANSNVIGVANYYVQRPLDLANPLFEKAMQACKDAANRIIQTLQDQGAYPWLPAMDNATQGIYATLDFLWDERNNGPVFLEAGPPFGLGAHPCAFERVVRSGGEISGFAF